MTSESAPNGDSWLLHALDRRRSTPAKTLTGPGPDQHQLLRILQAAVRVPDHGKLTPWRMLAVRGEARERIGQRLVELQLQRNPDISPGVLDKDRRRFSHAPLVLVVIASPHDTDRIPEQEQLLSAGCVCFALLQAAQAFGFGAQWLTGWPAYDAQVLQWFGLAANERIVGFIHIGTATSEPPERHRPDPSSLLQEWVG